MSETLTEDDILGGAQRGRIRPRGFVPWRLDVTTQALLDQVLAVLAEYAAHLPLTIRQIFYRLVAAHDFPKTEGDYKRLCRVLNRARRAKLISMDDIRDDGGTILKPYTYGGAEDFLATTRLHAQDLQLDRTLGQPERLVVMCEAEGMAPQLEQVASKYGIAVLASGGFDSLTYKYNFADQFTDHTRPTEVLHIGDHDPSGAHIFLALAEDVTAFAEEFSGDVTFTRLAVTPEQIKHYQLPTAPPKSTDNRAFSGQTCQAEALPPDVLADILRTAITDRLDERAYKRVLRAERQARRAVLAQLRG
jgi:hypothetical protein